MCSGVICHRITVCSDTVGAELPEGERERERETQPAKSTDQQAKTAEDKSASGAVSISIADTVLTDCLD